MNTRNACMTRLAVALIATFGITAASADTLEAGNIGWFRDNGGHGPYNFNFATGQNTGNEYRSFFTFDLSAYSGQTFTSATLHLWNSTINNGTQFGYDSADVAETLNVYDVAGNVTNLSNRGYGTNALDPVGQAIYADLGSGTLFGTVTVTRTGSGAGSYVDVTLNANGLSALNAAAGSSLALGSAVGSLGGNAGNQTLFSNWANNGPTYQSIEVGRAELIVSAVPEPTGALVLLGGLAAIGMAVRRRRPPAG